MSYSALKRELRNSVPQRYGETDSGTYRAPPRSEPKIRSLAQGFVELEISQRNRLVTGYIVAKSELRNSDMEREIETKRHYHL